jgi:hypothetical protein
MEFAIFVWVASVIGKLAGFFTGAAILFAAVVAVDIICTASHNGVYDEKKKYPFQKRWGKWCTFIAAFLMLIASLLPSEKTMYVMAGAWAGQKMVESEAAGKVMKIINLKLDEYLQEAEKELKK